MSSNYTKNIGRSVRTNFKKKMLINKSTQLNLVKPAVIFLRLKNWWVSVPKRKENHQSFTTQLASCLASC